MRVITGSARGKRLETAEGLFVRPTSQRVKEAEFSIIQFHIADARVLDLFAGSGQLGIEALSRGARRAVFVESDRRVAEILRRNLKNTGLSERADLRLSDALSFLELSDEIFDLVFLDPPYGKGLIQRALPLLCDKIADGGILLCESLSSEILPEREGKLFKYREYRYGRTKLTVLKKGDETG